jgi:hypothetical protein
VPEAVHAGRPLLQAEQLLGVLGVAGLLARAGCQVREGGPSHKVPAIAGARHTDLEQGVSCECTGSWCDIMLHAEAPTTRASDVLHRRS